MHDRALDTRLVPARADGATGADEERARLARDLHDHLGQSLASVALELERVLARARRAEDVTTPLAHLHDDVVAMVRDVRFTLQDLRADVTPAQGVAATLADQVLRVRGRSGLDVELCCTGDARLPPRHEHELWRIAQEALANAEHHAHARQVRIDWSSDDQRAHLRVADDGCGFAVDHAGRPDSYGIRGMRERAAAIGATLTIDSHPGAGTVVTCLLIRPAPGPSAATQHPGARATAAALPG